MRFTKMHGAGNDYVYVDCFGQTELPEPPDILSRKVAHRHFGVGGDGLILIQPSAVADARMRMFNADGSESEMCGNGLRCVAKYVYDHGIARRDSLSIETGRGVLQVQIQAEAGKARLITVDMGQPILDPELIPTTLRGSPTAAIQEIASKIACEKVVAHECDFDGQQLEVTCISMGNPHCVVFVSELTDQLVHGIGPKIECDVRFPKRTNVEFVQVISPTELRQRTWERGSGETWACGTGASAVCVAGVLTGRTAREVLIHLLGGDLSLRWDAETDHVFMTGGATEVFTGEWIGSD
jgi:diaminopimelate epimerase